MAVKIKKQVPYEKLNKECRICKRLQRNDGKCAGMDRLDCTCLAYEIHPVAAIREGNINQITK